MTGAPKLAGWRWCGVIMAGLGAVWLFWMSTNWGIGVSPDSATYLWAARNLLQGQGLTIAGQPLLHYPPAYPLFLAASGWLSGSDPVSSSRWAHALLFGLNVMLAGYAAYRLADNSALAATCAALLLAGSHVVLLWHVNALSEPLFIFLQLVTVIALWHYLVTSRKSWLAVCGLCAGLSAVTRYVGVTLILAVLATVFAVPQQTLRKRLAAVCWAGLPAFAPLLIWVARNYFSAGEATNRRLVPHFITPGKIWDGLNVMGSFIAPFGPFPLRALAFIGTTGFVAAAWVYLARRATLRHNVQAQGFLLLWGLVYVGFLLISISFFDADTPLDSRILLLWYIYWLLCGLAVIRSYAALSGRLILWRLTVAFCFLLALYNLRPLSQVVAKFRADGIGLTSGYTNRQWRASEGISYVRSLPAETPVYTNGVDAVQILTGRETKSFPAHTDAASLLPAAGYEQQIAQMEHDLATRQGVLVYFNALQSRDSYLARLDELKSRLNLQILRQTPDSIILTGAKPNSR